MASETVHYKRGVSQQFSMPSFKIDFNEWKEEDVSISIQQHFLHHKKNKLTSGKGISSRINKVLFHPFLNQIKFTVMNVYFSL